MTINKIYISAFGKLSDYTLEFNDGFNCVFGENENGKTTVMSFIKMMFYGGGKSSRQLSGNLRKKYKPWSGEKMGGRIYFEHSGKRWCLEREFRGSASTDRVILRNLDLGTGETVEPDIGKRFFGLSEAAFERSFFIGQPAFSTDETAAGELGARLSSLAATGDEAVSYALIQKRLVGALNELKTPRKVGKYDKGAAELELLRESYKIADLAAKRRGELTAEIRRLSSQLSAAQKEYSEASELVERENNLHLEKQLKEFLKAKELLDEKYNAATLSDGTRIDDAFIKKVDFCINRCRIAAEQRSIISDECDKLKNSISISEDADTGAAAAKAEKLRSRLNFLSEEQERLKSEIDIAASELDAADAATRAAAEKRKKCNLFLIAPAIAAAAAAIIFFIASNTVFAVVSGIFSAVMAALGFIFTPLDRKAISAAESSFSAARSRKAQLDAERAEKLQEANNCSAELNMLLSALNMDNAKLQQKKDELSEKESELHKRQIKETELLSELYSLSDLFCSSHSLNDIAAERDLLTEKSRSIDLQRATLNSLARLLGNISYDEAISRLKQISSDTLPTAEQLNNAKERLPQLNSLILELNGEQREAALELKRLSENAVVPADIERKISALAQALAEQERYFEAASMSLEVLEESFAELRRGYGAALEAEALKIFSGITDGKYKSLNISKSLEMEAEAAEAFGTHSIEYLSGGAVDQAYLSLRLAAAGLISDEPITVMLDDSLSQCDDKRARRAIAYFKNYCQNGQLILFTCHSAVYSIAEQLAANCISL